MPTDTHNACPCRFVVPATYFLACYFLACVFYLAMTFNMGTPFRKSLTASQIELLARSKRKRRNVFLLGCALGGGILWFWRPFRGC